jgi:hypothetical protein
MPVGDARTLRFYQAWSRAALLTHRRNFEYSPPQQPIAAQGKREQRNGARIRVPDPGIDRIFDGANIISIHRPRHQTG